MTDSRNATELDVVRIKLGGDRPAPQPDPLGRARIGYHDGLTTSELWERGRGVWKAKLPSVAAADLVVLVAGGVVVGVGSIDGVTFTGDRVAITGSPDDRHPLIGQPDPIPNESRNPIAYGTVHTVPTQLTSAPRSFDALLLDAIAVLTEAVRLRRPRMHQTSTGRWEAHPTETVPSDWAEFVTLALAGATANVGGIETALAGRPGSWESAGVRSLLESTLGQDEDELLRHRTEPIQITLEINGLLADYTDSHTQYDDADQEILRREDAAEQADPPIDIDQYAWVYQPQRDGDPVADSPDAPAWSREAWRAAALADGADERYLELFEARERDYPDALGTWSYMIPKSPEAGLELHRLEDGRAARLVVFAELADRLEVQRRREWTDYGDALKTRIEHHTASTGVNVPVEISVDLETLSSDPLRNADEIARRWIENAIKETPSPAELPGTPLERLELKAADTTTG